MVAWAALWPESKEQVERRRGVEDEKEEEKEEEHEEEEDSQTGTSASSQGQ